MKKINSKFPVEVRFNANPPWWLSMPRPGRIFTLSDYGIALVAALATLWLYLQTLSPTVTGEDSGEFITAAYTLGIPHPPGYPLYCLIGHLFTKLPWGEVAWRVNLMSACFGAGAVFVVALIVAYLTRNRFAALMGALALACSREFWAQSLVADVYSMNAFFFALCLLLLMLWKDIRHKRFLFVFAFLFGLGVAVHYTFLLLAPIFAMYVFFANLLPTESTTKNNILTMKDYVLLCVVAAVGLLPFLYLPIRSIANPPVDWGNPETFTNFINVMWRKQFESMFYQYPRSLERFLGQMAVYGRFWLGEFQPLGALLGLAGLLLLLRKYFWHGMLLVASGVVVLAGFSYWQNFEQTREWLWVMRVFGLPAYMITAIGIGVVIGTLWWRNRAYTALTITLALLCVGGSLEKNWQRNDKSSYYWTYDYGMNILESLPRDAVYLSASDHGSFSVLYLQHVLGIRSDVENLRKYGYFSGSLLAEMPAELRGKAGEFPKQRYETEILSWLLKSTDRPLYLSKPMSLPDAPGVHYAPAGLLFRALRPGETDSDRNYWQEYRWHTLKKEDAQGDYTADAILYEIATTKAYAAFIEAYDSSGTIIAEKQKEALGYIEESFCAYGRDPMVLNNAGVLCARHGLYHEACDYFHEALEKLPTMKEARRNLELTEKRLQ